MQVTKLFDMIVFEIHKTIYFSPCVVSITGASERAKSRLSRTSSLNSESPSDSPLHQPSTPSKKPASTPETARKQASEPKSRSSFFATLEWDSGAPTESGEVVEPPQPTEIEVRLLDASDNEDDDFVSLSRDRAGTHSSNGSDIGVQAPRSQDADFFSDFNAPASSDATQDLLNMKSTGVQQNDPVTDQMDLLNMGSEPSNFDLLGGSVEADASNAQSSNVQFGDAFDPFQEMASRQKPASQTNAAKGSGKTDAFGSFDPFQSCASTVENGGSGAGSDDFVSFMENQNQTVGGPDDLMGNWDASNILQSGGSNSNIPKPANAGGIGIGMSKSHSSSFPQQAGMSAPMSASQGGGIGPVPKADPFADLGESCYVHNEAAPCNGAA